METIWKDLEGYEGTYQISNQGDIRSIDRVVNGKNLQGKVLLKTKDEFGYRKVSLCKGNVQKTFRVCRLVAKMFPEICGEWFEGCQINHKNEKKDDDRAENLETCTPRYNTLYSMQPLSGRRKAEHYPVAMILNDEQIATFRSIRFAADITKISYAMIWKCAKGLVPSAGGYQWVIL